MKAASGQRQEAPGSSADHQAEPGAWQTLREAQRRLGLSERTLRRRIARGELPRRRRSDGRLEVFLPLTAELTAPAAPSAADPDQLERQLLLLDKLGEMLRGLLEPLQHDLREARALVERLALENGMLIRENALLKERLADLEQRLTAGVRELERPPAGRLDDVSSSG